METGGESGWCTLVFRPRGDRVAPLAVSGGGTLPEQAHPWNSLGSEAGQETLGTEAGQETR